MTVIGHAAGQDQLYAYADCIISILDINDNEPRFTQMVYFARAWEGNNKGTFVTQVMAVDEDSIENDQLYYQIVDGNHDGAFTIDQQYSGMLRVRHINCWIITPLINLYRYLISKIPLFNTFLSTAKLPLSIHNNYPQIGMIILFQKVVLF